MPVTSFADILRDWEKLLSACRENSLLLGDIEPLQSTLSRLLIEVREVKGRQEHLEGTRQAATQQLNGIVTEGKETARRLRRIVESRLGTGNEHLVEFGVAPIRKRKAARKPIDPPPPPPQE
jgi:hypothetical protein